MIDLRFESEAVPVDTFQVLQFDGEEEISHLFRFELRLVSRDPKIDLAAVLQSHAKLAITTQDKTRYVHGMLCEFEQGGEWHSGLYEYRAVLVPRLWMMTQSTQNQIFQTQTVPDIVERELGSVAEKGRHPLVAAGLGVDDYEIYNTASYAEREYVVQFKETDFNFISRLMEHEGIYYYFEHDDHREKMVITDTMATEQISAQNSAEFQANATAARYDDSVVHKLSRIQSQIPGSVLVSDHNYRAPDLPMQATGDVAQDGIGFVTEFGAHFKSPEEGVTLATIRAEEYRCRQNIYAGESNIASFACGHLCSLNRHFRSDYNQDYLLTRVKHHGSQDIESWGKVGSTSYHNEFSCIPANIPFRPQRLTPKPRLYGIMNGTIDSEQDLGRADLDEQGRYKVKMPFDISGAGAGMGSRRIRMAQPYGGGGAGMSFPLVKGTEVIWTCIDGDIDRPIITGTVPNPLNPSVTTAENSTSNVIKTASGITVGIYDGTGSGGANQSGSGDGLAAQQQNQSIKPSLSPPQNSQSYVTENLTYSNRSSQPGQSEPYPIDQQQQMMADPINFSTLNEYQANYLCTTGKQFSIAVPDYEDAIGVTTAGHKDSYLRLGGPSTWELEWGDPWDCSGWSDYTDGDRLSITQGRKIEYIGDRDAFPDNPSITTTILDNANIRNVKGDTISQQVGDIYDFGGYWNYNLGNSYAEDHIRQDAVLNTSHTVSFPADGMSFHVEALASQVPLLVTAGVGAVVGFIAAAAAGGKGGAAISAGGSAMWAGIAFLVGTGVSAAAQGISIAVTGAKTLDDLLTSPGGDTPIETWSEAVKASRIIETDGVSKLEQLDTAMVPGTTWVSKTFGDAYSFNQGNSIEISHGNSESHTTGDTHEYVYGGTHEETKFNGKGIRTSWSKSGGGQGQEMTCNPVDGAFTKWTYTDTRAMLFSFEIALATLPKTDVSVSLSSLQTTFTASAGVKADFEISAGLSTSMKASIGFAMEVEACPAWKLKINPDDGVEFSGPGTKVNKDAEIKASILGAIVEHRKAAIIKKDLEASDYGLELKGAKLSMATGQKIDA